MMQIFLTEKDVAKQINVSLATLRRWRLERRGPQSVKVGALVRYRPEDLEQWMAALPTGGAAPQRENTRLAAVSG
jgi:excisionase family DNA binding protein